MKSDDSTYVIEQRGILAVDRYLITSLFAILGLAITAIARENPLKPDFLRWGVTCVSCSFVAIFLFLWHQFRWPIRLKRATTASEEAVNAMIDAMVHILEDVAGPKAREAVFGRDGEKVIKGANGDEYVRGPMEEIKKTYVQTLMSVMKTDNPLVANTISAHSTKIAQTHREALSGKLPEKWVALKCPADFLARNFRYPSYVVVIVTAVILATTRA